MTDLILAANSWTSNADLILDCVELGYLRKEWRTLDPTYGRGNWWKKWRPDDLVATDIGAKLSFNQHDFRAMPWEDSEFDAITFDPPYMAPGGRKSSTIPEFNDRFGLHELPRRPEGTQELINDGITECVRVLKPGGFLLVKCMDYINAGAFWPGTHHTLTHGLSTGLRLIDRMEHVGRPGPQPPRPRQLHARRNLSTLFVFKLPKKKVTA